MHSHFWMLRRVQRGYCCFDAYARICLLVAAQQMLPGRFRKCVCFRILDFRIFGRKHITLSKDGAVMSVFFSRGLQEEQLRLMVCSYYSLGHFMSKMDHWPVRGQNPGAAWLSLIAGSVSSATLFRLDLFLWDFGKNDLVFGDYNPSEAATFV